MVPRPTIRLLRRLNTFPNLNWGFAIYRTAYDHTSHQLYPRVMEFIKSSTKQAISAEQADYAISSADTTAYEVIRSRYRPVIMDDPTCFAGLSLAAVRSHFEAYTEECQAREEQNSISHRACLVIDDEVLWALDDAVAQTPAKGEFVDAARTRAINQEACWVKTVEAWPDLDETHDDYDGSMKCSVFALWSLWQWTSDPDPIAFLIREESGVYIG